MARFKIDENLPIESAALLSAAGHDALTVLDQGLGGKVDEIVAEICRVESRALITLDLDFADIRAYPPADFAGIVVVRPSRLDRGRILSLLQRLASAIEQEPLAGTLWVVDESSIRIRQ